MKTKLTIMLLLFVGVVMGQTRQDVITPTDSVYVKYTDGAKTGNISYNGGTFYVKDDAGYGKLYSTTITLANALSSNDSVTSGNPYVKYSLVDDAYYDMKSSIAGRGSLSVVDATNNVVAYADFYYNSDGTVYNITSTSNVDYANTDVKVAIFDNGSNVRIRNRLGATHTLKLQLWY